MKPLRANLSPSARGSLGLPCLAAACLLGLLLAGCGSDDRPGASRPAAPRKVLSDLHERGEDDRAGQTRPRSASDLRAEAKIEHMLAKAGVTKKTGTVDPFHASTPLHDAAAMGDLDEVRRLLDEGADLTVADSDRSKPIHIAASRGHVEVVALLIERGADPRAEERPRPDSEPIHAAAANGSAEVVVLLLDNAVPVDAPDNVGSTPLHAAALAGDAAMVELLLSRGASLSAKNRAGFTPLHTAAYGGDVEVARILLDAGAPIDERENAGTTALYMAAQEGNGETALLLIERGADINMRFPYSTITYRAAARGHKEIADMLLAHGGKWKLPPPEPGEEVFRPARDPRIIVPGNQKRRGGGFKVKRKNPPAALEATEVPAASAEPEVGDEG